jgi:hypothetical protein
MLGPKKKDFSTQFVLKKRVYNVYILNIDIMLIFINTYQIQYNVVNLLSEFKTREHIFFYIKKNNIF